MSYEDQLWTIVVLMLIAAGLAIWRRRHLRPPAETCAACGGTVLVDALCTVCNEPLHIECWDRHLCKYRIN